MLICKILILGFGCFKDWLDIFVGLDVEDWCFYDVCCIVVINMVILKVLLYIIEVVLNYKFGIVFGVVLIYNCYVYLDEKCEVL